MSDRKPVYIIDDDSAARDGLAVLLEAHGFSVTQFGDAQSFLNQAGNLLYGCIILDLRMPKIDGITLQKMMNDRGLSFPVIILTGFADVPLAVEAMRMGAMNFLEKPVSPDTLIDAIEEAQARAEDMNNKAKRARAAAKLVDSLTPRERDVLSQMVKGHANKEAGLALGLSPRTVEVHRKRVFEKFGVKSLANVVEIALSANFEPNSASD